MMEYITQVNVYSEVYSLLNALRPQYIKALPKKIYSLIEENRDKLYNPTYDLSIPMYKQNISKKGTAFICLLHYNYWCTSEEEKNRIDKVLKYNTEKVKEEYSDYEKMFNTNKPQISKENIIEDDSIENKNNVAIAVKKDDTIFRRIWKFVRNVSGK